MSTPTVCSPTKVLDTTNLTISEYFGRVATKDDAASFALVEVRAADEAAFQTPAFAEYIICTEGSIELECSDGHVTRVEAGVGCYLPPMLRLRWRFPGVCKYTVVCAPAFSPELASHEEGGTIVDPASREKLKELHRDAGSTPSGAAPVDAAAKELRPALYQPVNVVEAPGITITEHFGMVASREVGSTASLGVAVVKGASEEAWQCPQFDEFVICAEGSIDFLHGGGEKVHIDAGQGIFLPKGLRVKWVWPEACKYFVLCLPAFNPALSGREAEEGATVAKDSASMQRLEKLHAETTA